VPTRGRPAKASELSDAFHETAVSKEAWLVLVIDEDDPDYDAYRKIKNADEVLVVPPGRPGMGDALNEAAREICARRSTKIIGFWGDDHTPRTMGWDAAVVSAFNRGSRIIYGNDLLQGENLPTAVFMDAQIVRQLGYMSPPGLQHLWIDNAWLEWGRQIDAIEYLPKMIIEHVHPLAEKAKWDDGYERVNAPSLFDADKIEFERYLKNDLRSDVKKMLPDGN